MEMEMQSGGLEEAYMRTNKRLSMLLVGCTSCFRLTKHVFRIYILYRNPEKGIYAGQD